MASPYNKELEKISYGTSNVSDFFKNFDNSFQDVLMTGKNDALAIICEELKTGLNKVKADVDDFIDQANAIIAKINSAIDQDASASREANNSANTVYIKPGTSESEALALRQAAYDKKWREERSAFWDD